MVPFISGIGKEDALKKCQDPYGRVNGAKMKEEFLEWREIDV